MKTCLLVHSFSTKALGCGAKIISPANINLEPAEAEQFKWFVTGTTWSNATDNNQALKIFAVIANSQEDTMENDSFPLLITLELSLDAS